MKINIFDALNFNHLLWFIAFIIIGIFTIYLEWLISKKRKEKRTKKTTNKQTKHSKK